jgi:thiamine biosynthesis protein ThiI
VKDRYLQLVLKRQMLRAADALARRHGAVALVTGDAIGQVASQTLRNLEAMGGATDLPILRPLLSMDKEAIVAASVPLGTHDLSAGVIEHCAVTVGRPATAASRRVVEEQERFVDPEPLARAIAEARTVQLRSPMQEPRPEPVEIGHIPAGAAVLDVRSRAAYEAWHYPESRHAQFPEVLARLDAFESSRVYVAYCAFGAKSSVLAEALRRRGAQAYSFAGGTRGLMEWAAERGVPTPEEFAPA